MLLRRHFLLMLVAAYLAMATFTFGHSAAHNQRFQDQRCATAEARQQAGAECHTSPGGIALFAAFIWPLYWSWELQS